MRPTPSSDVYSLGITAWQILARKLPFENLHSHTILYLTGKGSVPEDDKLDDELQNKYKELYREMWKKNPNDRIKILSVIEKLIILKNQCN